jgi:hypothetical protein|tara:strand:+ start:437 stop:673 length:237 start_codon:yes stop_codon:yes gene_type:complete
MIDTEYLPETLQDIYLRLMVDADDVGMSYDEVMMYVEQFEMDDDMLFSFVKEKIEENKKKDGKEVMESLKRSLRDPLS